MTTNGGIWSNLTTDILKSIPVPIPSENYLDELIDTLKSATNAVKEASTHLEVSKTTYGILLNHLIGVEKTE